MSKLDYKDGGPRLQDLVAKMSGVSLKNSVKVIETLVNISEMYDEEFGERLNSLIDQSSVGRGPLTRPDIADVERCNKAYTKALNDIGSGRLSEVRGMRLDTDSSGSKKDEEVPDDVGNRWF